MSQAYSVVVGGTGMAASAGWAAITARVRLTRHVLMVPAQRPKSDYGCGQSAAETGSKQVPLGFRSAH